MVQIWDEVIHNIPYYPKFLNWVKTKGKEDADWYLHPSNK